jgi:hypothetical protein
MAFQFKESDIRKIEQVLAGQFQRTDNCFRMVLESREEKRRLSLEIYADIPIGKKRGNLISVYTPSSHLQLHFCSGYVVSEMLGEVTFIGEYGGRLSGLIIEKDAACSHFSNVDANLLSGDFTKLGPEVMLSGIALSLAEHILPEEPSE